METYLSRLKDEFLSEKQYNSGGDEKMRNFFEFKVRKSGGTSSFLSVILFVFVIFSILILVFLSSGCSRGAGKSAGNSDKSGSGKGEVVLKGNVKAGNDFKEEGETGGQLITGRIITGRIITARAPESSTEGLIPVGGALVEVEQLGVSTYADEDGGFEIPVSVSGCPCNITLSVGAVRKDGRSYRVRKEIDISERDMSSGVKEIGDLVILATGGVAGKVNLQGADSNMGVYVYIPGTPMISITDEDGNFIMGDIPPGVYDFAFEKVGYETKITRNVEVRAGELIFIGEYELQVASQGDVKYIQGKVLDSETKEPIPGAFIFSDTGKAGITDKYGNFSIQSEGVKKITVRKEGYEVVEYPVEGTSDKVGEITISLSPKNLKKGVIIGEVYNWRTTRPVGGVKVVLLPVGNLTVTAEDGSFVIKDVPPGNYTLMFSRSGYEIGIAVVSIRNGEAIDLGILGLLPDCEVARFYADRDGDGFGDPESFTEDCYAPFGYVGIANDCNDTDTSVHPGAVEICNGRDDNCDGRVDEGVLLTFYRDQDGDGYGNPNSTTQACSRPAGYVSNFLDCDDTKSYVNPGTYEVCDDIDNDCSGIVNDGVLSIYYRDEDGDGQGDISKKIFACQDSNGRLRDINGNIITLSYVPNSLDCNDSNPDIRFGINETRCDGVDENCNGIIDDGVLLTFYRDADGDRYGDPNSITQACSYPAGYTSDKSDCDDTNPAFNPGITEVVDGRDENCDGIVDNLNFEVETIDSLSPVFYLDLAIDNRLNIHAAFVYQAYGGIILVGYSKREGGAWWWGGAKSVNSSTSERHNVSIDVSPDGATAYLSYYSGNWGDCPSGPGSGSGLCVNYKSGAGWGAGNGKLIDSGGTKNDIKFDSQNSITHVVYVRNGTEIVHTYATPSTPDFSSSLSSVVYGDPATQICDIDTALSPDGATIHIVFIKGNCVSTSSSYPYYTRNLTPYNFSAWMPAVALTTYEYGANSVGIAVSQNGVTHVCLTGRTTPFIYYMEAQSGGGFSGPYVVDGDGPMVSCSITLDGDGNPHIAYISTPYEELRYATKLGSNWKKYSVSNIGSDVVISDGVSIKVDSRKNPHIGFIGYNLPRYATTKPKR